jgi:5-methyltetrahydropteroyltriglutamate--homocysteine methyltransferase
MKSIEKFSREIYEALGAKLRIKMCITGPYTLSHVFAYRYPDLFMILSELLRDIVSQSIIKNKYIDTAMVTVDEPAFALSNDSLIDYGSEGRLMLRKAWKDIFHTIYSSGVDSSIHLHSTSDPLFWEIDDLLVIDSHVSDSIYSSPRTKEQLERYDKFLKVSVSITDYDELILRRKKSKEYPDQDYIADVWRGIRSGSINPSVYLEDVDTIARRLKKAIDLVGYDRVKYAGPECGLRGFPDYETSIEYLMRVSKAIDTVISGK